MSKKHDGAVLTERARPVTVHEAKELQHYGTVARLPLALDASVCAASAGNLNQLLADTMTLRDLYKKHHWQVSGPTFYQLIFSSTSTSMSRASSWTPSRSGSSHWAA